MKKLLLIIAILCYTPLCYATQNVFYSPEKSLKIIDISGSKSTSDIAQEYSVPIDTLQTVTIDETTQGSTIDDTGNLISTDKQAQSAQLGTSTSSLAIDPKQPAIDKLKSMGWTDDEINSLLGR